MDFEEERLPDPFDVTWVAQLSLDRLQMLESLCELWEGPMSISLYLSDDEAETFLRFVSESVVLSRRRNIGYHVVYKQAVNYSILFA